MSTYQSTPQRKHGTSVPTGVLLVNLGTPDAPTASSVRRFLRPFLSDPRVIEYPRILWWLVLNLVILRIRPPRSAAAYRKIWMDAGSPLMVHSTAVRDAVQQQLDAAHGERFRVELAMRYGEPSIDSAIDKLLARGAGRIVTLPMYPQYSGTTTASVNDAVAEKYSKLRWIPEARFINDYHDAPGYISALAKSIRAAWADDGRGDKLLMSFHGVPSKTVERGDPYEDQCRKTALLLAAALELADDEWVLTFQSRVGREEWLSPYTDQTLTQLASQGTHRVDVVCPGFSVDCLETLEEIEMQNSELFIASGGVSLRYIPALNAHDSHVAFLTDLIKQHSAGWSSDASDASNKAKPRRAIGAIS